MVAPPACEPDQDTSATFSPRLDRLAQGQPPLLAVRLPHATGLASYLSGCLSSCRSAVPFLISPTLRRVFTGLAWTSCPSRCQRSLCPAFRRLSFGESPCGDRQSHRPVLIHSSNPLPSGNCDSLRPETFPSYLIRFRTVSHRPSSLSPFFACTDDARTSPEELVNPASAPEPHDPA